MAADRIPLPATVGRTVATVIGQCGLESPPAVTHTDFPDRTFPCECGRGDTRLVAFPRRTSLLVRRLDDIGHWAAADLRCVDCIADMAIEIANCAIPGYALGRNR